jgi:hypothetical protein
LLKSVSSFCFFIVVILLFEVHLQVFSYTTSPFLWRCPLSFYKILLYLSNPLLYVDKSLLGRISHASNITLLHADMTELDACSCCLGHTLAYYKEKRQSEKLYTS